MKNDYLTIQQAANLLGVSTKTLRRWEAKGVLTPERTPGNQRRYLLPEIEAFKQKGKEGRLSKNIVSPPANHISTVIPQEKPQANVIARSEHTDNSERRSNPPLAPERLGKPEILSDDSGD